MAAGRDIRRRIKSINNTKKITKAMELVSAAKMRKATNRVTSSRPYSNTSWQVLLDLSGRAEKVLHPLLEEREPIQNVALVVISSNRGLCGGFNSHIVELAVKIWREAERLGQKVEFITLGKRARDELRRLNAPIVADFEKDDVTTDILKLAALVKLIMDDFIAGKYDKVELVYTDFISTLVQKPHLKRLLPLETRPDELLGEVGEAARPQEQPALLKSWQEYIFEPSTLEILEDLLPRLLEVQVYQAVLETEASEHSARMIAMRNASDAAADIISDLTLTYNQARQAGITREIAEISAGKIALE